GSSSWSPIRSPTSSPIGRGGRSMPDRRLPAAVPHRGGPMSVSRVDLHVHSRYSDRPTEWVLRRIGAPECYTQPRAVYDIARRRGMQFATISDHNCIDGALEIAHLPGAFISNEVTAYFPEDGCKIHVLCWNITEAQFRDIQEVRRNIVELRDYFLANHIVHA